MLIFFCMLLLTSATCADNVTQTAQMLLATAEAVVALGESAVFGSDDVANKTSDIKGANALARVVQQSRLTPTDLHAAFSAAIAQGLNESAEATAVLIASAVMVNSTSAVVTTATGIKEVSQSTCTAGQAHSTRHANLCNWKGSCRGSDLLQLMLISCSAGTNTRFADLTQAVIIVDIAVAAGLASERNV